MAIFRRVVGGLVALFQKRKTEADLDDELRHYLETAVEDKMTKGMSREEALRAARLEMGSLDAVKERVREAGWESLVEILWQDVRLALRMLNRSPGLAAVAVLTIAIGTGAATSMFSIMHSLLLAPPPHVQAPDRVFKLHQLFPASQARPSEPTDRSSYPFYELLAEQAPSLSGVAAYTQHELPAGTGPDARMTRSVMISAGFWKTLGVKPALGRFIADEEAHPATGSRVAVLGHAFWRRHLGGRPDVIGRTLTIRGQPYEIIGVAPRAFRGVELADVDLWLPLFAYEDGSGRDVTWHTFGGSFNLSIVMRLRPEVTVEQASAELSVLQWSFLEETHARHRQFLNRFRGVQVLLGSVTGALGRNLRPIPEARVSVWLVGVAFVLLAIACSNVAGLLLLRAMRRRREIALRLALGVSRWRLTRQFLIESSILALLGGLVAVFFVAAGGAWLQRSILPAMAWEPIALIKPSVLAVAGLCIIGTTFAAGLAPVYYARSDGVSALRSGFLRGPARRPRMQGILLAVQGALSVVLLVGAGLFLRSLNNIETVDIGLDRDNVLAVQIDFAGTGRTADGVGLFFEQALERVSAVPGVAQASLALDVPLRSARAGSLRLPGRESLPDPPTGGPYVNSVSPGFFATTGMRIKEGREFREEERNSGAAVIVSETMARLYWPNRSPVGECVYVPGEETCAPVVGVVADTHKFRIIEESRYLSFYRPLAFGEGGAAKLLVRMQPGAGRLDAAVRQAMLDLDPTLPYIRIETLGEVLYPQMRPWRLGAAVFTAFAILAVILAVIGVWSSVAYAVSQRRPEFAIRMAVGASGHSLVGLMLKNGLKNAMVATASGLVVAAVSSRFIADLLFEVSPRDPAVFSAVGAVILGAATLASLIPAWRASRIDPAAALRAD